MCTTREQQDLYLDACHEAITRLFRCDPGLGRDPARSCLSASMVGPEDGSTIYAFNPLDLEWYDSGEKFTDWQIHNDGRVLASFPQDFENACGMEFKLGHPQEVAELLFLFTRAAADFEKPATTVQPVRLGQIADLYVLMPFANEWRALNLANLSSPMPPDFRDALSLNLAHDWDSLAKGRSCIAGEFAMRWPEFVRHLPDATPLIRDGYVSEPGINLHAGLQMLREGPRVSDPFLRLLVVPVPVQISTLYLREYLNGDRDAAQQLRKAFEQAADAGNLYSALKEIEIQRAPAIFDQLRMAAPINLMRQRVLTEAAILANGRTDFAQLVPKYKKATEAVERAANAIF